MLHTKLLPKVIEQAVGDEIRSSILFNAEGSLLATTGEDTVDSRLIGAITANICSAYEKAGRNSFDTHALNTLLLDLEHGRVLARRVCGGADGSTQLILGLVGTPECHPGMMRSRADAVQAHLAEPLSEIFGES
eukprot:gb/GECH01003319.1/.p1 GENE.gb/GECH01003319.1/~~gb/GECH01003319.1/.p1  ORF type:complete len:134 (+),score=23.98 gb/GECH01003319.1/:1-402(+)